MRLLLVLGIAWLTFFSNSAVNGLRLRVESSKNAAALQPDTIKPATTTTAPKGTITTKSVGSSGWIIPEGIPGNVTLEGNELTWISVNDLEDDNDVLMDPLVTCNAYWSDGTTGVNSGEHYWEFTFVSLDHRGAAVGLTNQQRFNNGTVAFGLLYDGYLTTGDGDLLNRTALGPAPRTDEVIGVLASFTQDKRLQISFFWNGQPLGLGYNVEASVLPNAFPAVQLADSGLVSIAKVTPPPLEARTPKPFDLNELTGEWEVIPASIKSNGTVSNETLEAQVKESDLKLRLSLSPAFSMDLLLLDDETEMSTNDTTTSTPLTIKQNDDLKTKGWHMGHLSAGWEFRFHIAYEKNAQNQLVWKMVEKTPADPENDDDLRPFLEKLFAEPDLFQLNQDKNLYVKKSPYELVFQRYDAAPTPVTIDPFTAINTTTS